MFRTKDQERRVVKAVAEARGCAAEESDDDQQDGWIITPSGERVAAEVTVAFPEADGTRYARSYQRAGKDASKRGASFTVTDGKGIVIDPGDTLPVSMEPVNPLPGILAAIEKKSNDVYGPQSKDAILIVVQVGQVRPLDSGQLSAVNSPGWPFREVWIIDEFGSPPQHAA